jgi:hypothetical protein
MEMSPQQPIPESHGTDNATPPESADDPLTETQQSLAINPLANGEIVLGILLVGPVVFHLAKSKLHAS